MTRNGSKPEQKPCLRPLSFGMALKIRMARLRMLKASASMTRFNDDDKDAVADALTALDLGAIESAIIALRDAVAACVISLPEAWLAEKPEQPVDWSDPAALDLLREDRYSALIDLITNDVAAAETDAKNS